MSKEIICPECQTANTPGSKFCNNCGERLPLSTSLICPNCNTPNPRNRFYCDNCGTRLIKETPKSEEPEPPPQQKPETGSFFSLPVRPPGETGDLDPLQIVPDWLEKQGKEEDEEDVPRQHMPKIEDVGPAKKVTDDLPDWLVDEHDPDPIIGSPRIITTEHYMNLMKEPEDEIDDELAETADDAKLPDWLSDLAAPSSHDQAVHSEDRSTADDALNEWLAGISGEETGGDEPGDEDDTPAQTGDFFEELASTEEPTTGWLIGDEDESEPLTADSSAGLEAEDEAMGSEVFDWLSESLAETGSFSAPSFSEEEDEEEAEIAADLDDWLADLADGGAADSPSAAMELDLSGLGDEDDLSGWLDDDDAFEAVDTNLLAGLTDAVAQQDMDTPDEMLPTWMAELTEQDGDDADDTAVPEQESLPSWMSEFTTADADHFEEEISAKLEALDDADLDELAGEAEGTGEFTGMTEDLADFIAEEDDSWLDDLTAAAIEDEEHEPPAAAEPETVDDILDSEPTETGPLPDWLSGMGEDDSLVTEDADDTLFTGLFAADETDDDILDWIAEDEPAAEAADEPEEMDEEPADDAFLDSSDWLTEMASMGEEAFASDEASEPPAEPETAVEESELTSATLESDLFAADWTDEDEDEAADAPAEEAALEISDSTWGDSDSILAEALDDELPDWIEELGPPIASEPPAMPDEVLPTSESLPDWIAHMKPGSVFSDTGGLSDSVGLPDITEDFTELADLTDELVSAELPDWLQDEPGSGELAGVEGASNIPDWLDMAEETDSVEGGLFGLGSQSSEDEGTTVLQDLPSAPPIEERVVKAKIPDWILALKPSDSIDDEPEAEPAASGPLAGLANVLEMETAVIQPQGNGFAAPFTITPEQQSQATLLKQLALADRKTVQKIGASETAPPSWIRLVLVILLLAAILAGLLRPNLLQRAPAAVPTYLEAAHATIEANSGTPVLLAVEYTPAMSAELDPQLAMLLAQLEANNNPIVTVSQSAAGTAVIQRMAGSYPTLGLLPGQAVGLRQLSDCLAANCATLTGKTLTSSTQQSLADVSLIIVLTGERDNLVDWLEQIALIHDIPVVAGLTQSLGPVALPYLDSAQLQGMIAGLPDTAVYQQALLAQTPDDNIMRQLSAQTLGQLLAAVLLLLGGLVYGITYLIKRENGS